MIEINSPMLAKVGTEDLMLSESYIYQQKLDGCRALFLCDFQQNSMKIQNRKFKDVSSRYPEFSLNSIKSAFIGIESVILDGELCYISDGEEDFSILQIRDKDLNSELRRDLLSKRYPLTYHIFDLLFVNGCDIRDLPLNSRLEILNQIFIGNDRVKTVETVTSKTVNKLWNSVTEGIMAKLKYSPYIEKRSDYWLKIKKWDRSEIDIIKGEVEHKNLIITTSMGRVSIPQKENIDYFFANNPKRALIKHYPKSSSKGNFRFPIFERFLE